MKLFAFIFQTKKRTFHSYQRRFYSAVSHLLFLASPEAPSCPLFYLFFPVCAHLCPAECLGQPSRQQTRKSALLPARRAASFSSSLSGQQTVEERASLSKLMARALLPGLKMNRNVVYLKHTRPPPGRKITQHSNSRPRLWAVFYPGG